MGNKFQVLSSKFYALDPGLDLELGTILLLTFLFLR